MAITNYPFMNPNGTIDSAKIEEGDNLLQVPAAIARYQWEDYLSRFVPFEDLLMQETHYQNPAIVDQAFEKALPQVSAAIDVGQGMQERRLAAFGQNITAPMRSQMDQSWNSEKTLAKVDAANRIRQSIAARSRDIAFGGTTSARAAIDVGG